MSRPAPAWRPPDRDFVPASRVSVTAHADTSVIDFLQARLPLVADWAQRLQRGEVLDAHGVAVTADSPCRRGSVLWYWRQVDDEAPVPVDVMVLHQDERLVFIDKPHGLSVLPGGRHVRETVLIRLRRQLGILTLSPLHRLDLETAGVMAFGIRPEERAGYQALFRDRRVTKRYQALVRWSDALSDAPAVWQHRLEEPGDDGFMQMQVVDGEPNSELHIRMLRQVHHLSPGWDTDSPQGWALVELTPSSGRKHQLRAQLNAMGCPIVGDRIYPTLWPPGPAELRAPLQLLATELAFTDPHTGQDRHVRSRKHLAALPETKKPDSNETGFSRNLVAGEGFEPSTFGL